MLHTPVVKDTGVHKPVINAVDTVKNSIHVPVDGVKDISAQVVLNDAVHQKSLTTIEYFYSLYFNHIIIMNLVIIAVIILSIFIIFVIRNLRVKFKAHNDAVKIAKKNELIKQGLFNKKTI